MPESKPFFKSFIRRAFSLYVLTVLSIWIFVRVIPPDILREMVRGINVPTLLEKYEEIYSTQNIPEDNPVHKFAPVVFLLFLAAIYLKFPSLYSWFKRSFQEKPLLSESIPNSVRGIWLTGFFIVIVLLNKEFIDPYFFTQDDNHAQFLPRILVGMEMLFQGEFPFLDNFQHFGSQLFAIGTYAILDPTMILSYAACKAILNQPYATIEIYVILSMFIGAIFLGYAFRMLKVDSLLSFSGIVCFLLCGYFFITIRSWYYVAGITCYLPALFYLFLRGNSRGGWSWFLSAGIIRGLFFYAGNAQYFAYTLMIEAAAYAFAAAGRRRASLFIHYCCSVLLTIGIALPLLFLQLEVQKEIERWPEPVIARAGIPMDAVISTILPYPASWTPHPYGWGNENTYLMTNMFHIGFAWVLPFLLGVIAFVRGKAGRHSSLLVSGSLLFLLSAGVVSLIYPLKFYIPFLNKMYIPFKLLPYAAFAIILYSTLALSDLKKFTSLRNAISALAIFSVTISLLISLFGTSTSFYSYAEKPYPLLNQGIATNIKQGDILFGLAPLRYDKKPYATSLIHNYGCLYDLKATGYYDPLLPTKINNIPENPDEYFSRYGVTKAVFLKTKEHVEYWEYPNRDEHIKRLSLYPVVYEDDDIILYNTNQPAWILRPVADEKNATSRITEYDRTKIKAEIRSVSKSQWEYHNEYKKGYFIRVNGTRGEIVPSPDGWCMFELPSGEFDIEIRYMPPKFWKGVLLGLFTAVMAIAAFLVVEKKSRSKL